MGVRGAQRALRELRHGVSEFGSREEWEASTLQDQERRRRSSVASERVSSLWEGDISQFTLGEGVCVCVMVVVGGGVHLFP